MPIFQADPTQDVGGFPVYPKGEYLVQIGEPKAFFRKSKKEVETYGIAYPLTIVEAPDPQYNGKKMSRFTAYQHTSGARDFAKGFLLAASGFSTKQEEDWNHQSKAAGLEWGFNTETGETADGWKTIMGNKVYVSISTRIDEETGKDSNNFDSFRPFVPQPEPETVPA